MASYEDPDGEDSDGGDDEGGGGRPHNPFDLVNIISIVIIVFIVIIIINIIIIMVIMIMFCSQTYTVVRKAADNARPIVLLVPGVEGWDPHGEGGEEGEEPAEEDPWRRGNLSTECGAVAV